MYDELIGLETRLLVQLWPYITEIIHLHFRNIDNNQINSIEIYCLPVYSGIEAGDEIVEPLSQSFSPF